MNEPEREPYRRGSQTAWAAARADYLAGRPAEWVCERHGLGLSALRKRARAEGWRRCDQPPPPAEDDDDDLFGREMPDPSWLADQAVRRLGRAVIRGRVREARSWALVVRDLRRLAEDEVRAAQEAEELREDYRAGLIEFPTPPPSELLPLGGGGPRSGGGAAQAQSERGSPSQADLGQPGPSAVQSSPAPAQAPEVHAFHPVFSAPETPPPESTGADLSAARARLLAAVSARVLSPPPPSVHSPPTSPGTARTSPVDGCRTGSGPPHGRGPPVPCPELRTLTPEP